MPRSNTQSLFEKMLTINDKIVSMNNIIAEHFIKTRANSHLPVNHTSRRRVTHRNNVRLVRTNEQ